MGIFKQAQFSALLTLGHAAISANYAKVGVSFAHIGRIVTFTNNTDGDMFFAVTNGATPASDGTADNIFVPTVSSRQYQFTTNGATFTNGSPFALPKGSQIWVRQSTASTKNDVWVEVVSAVGE